MRKLFNNMIRGRAKDKLDELLIDAELHHIEHFTAAAHHFHLASMYEQRVKWAKEELAKRSPAPATVSLIQKEKV